MSHYFALNTDTRDNITRIDNALVNIVNRLEQVKARLDNLYHQEETVKQEVGKLFPQEVELFKRVVDLLN